MWPSFTSSGYSDRFPRGNGLRKCCDAEPTLRVGAEQQQNIRVEGVRFECSKKCGARGQHLTCSEVHAAQMWELLPGLA